MMQDENILIRALEPEDLEYLYKWENDMDLWDVSDTLTPFSHFTLKKYIENAPCRHLYQQAIAADVTRVDTQEPTD